jgi:hypothetical protein
MEVYVVIREDQNEHGFVDASISAIFLQRADAEAHVGQGKSNARTDGLRVSGDENADWEEADWEVYYKIEAHRVE